MNEYRRQEALKVRMSAADLAFNRPHPRHLTNGDEQKFRRNNKEKCEKDQKNVPSYLTTFTKGMPHDYETGLVSNPTDVQNFIKAIDSGDPRDFKDVTLGPKNFEKKPPSQSWCSQKAKKARDHKVEKDCDTGASVRAWESQGAGNTYDLEGPDAQALCMPPAPILGSDELTAEIAEVYAQALLRDTPFTEFNACTSGNDGKNKEVDHIISELNKLKWFKSGDCCDLTLEEQMRKRDKLTRQTVFRGITPGDDIGPYLSQFLLAGDNGINNDKTKVPDKERKPEDGLIAYGAISINQRVRYATPNDDHMKTWDEWYDVQQGADLRGLENYEKKPYRRFITTPRDLATYVHHDALYEAYLNACLLLLSNKIPFDPGIPFQEADIVDHQQGFAHFGGPHILTIVTEVATRALKAVRFQKFNVHRRLRPEVLAARFEKQLDKSSALNVDELDAMIKAIGTGAGSILRRIKDNNDSYLLPMAFCEGSPMHPSYGAGHATVAGACVTILKAFFDHKHPLDLAVKGNPGKAFVSRFNGKTNDSYLEVIDVKEDNKEHRKYRRWYRKCRPIKDCESAYLTVEGELNKLASNISIGRDWAGVHYFTDYIESMRMGEQVAIGILEEQKLTYGENFSMTVPLFDGGSIRI